MAVADIEAAPSDIPSDISQRPRPALKAASPKIPLSKPIEVIPTCTEDRNCVGFSSSANAACAPLSPASANASRRALRLEANANSDIANTPLSSVSNAISRKSMARP